MKCSGVSRYTIYCVYPLLAAAGGSNGEPEGEHGAQTQAKRRTPDRRDTTAGATNDEPTTANQAGTAEAGTHSQRKQQQRAGGTEAHQAAEPTGSRTQRRTGSGGRGNRTKNTRRRTANTTHHTANRQATQPKARHANQSEQAQARKRKSQPSTTNKARQANRKPRKTRPEKRKNNTRNTPTKNRVPRRPPTAAATTNKIDDG